jgi:phosphoglycerate dehydrogenase-like enzyme
MPDVEVVIATSLPADLMSELTSIDAGTHISVLDDEQRAQLRPGLASSQDPAAAKLRRLLSEAEVIFLSFDAPPDVHELAKKARWIHTTAAGVENLLKAGFGRGSYTFTNGSGPHAISIGEYIVMQALVLTKCLPAYQRQQMQKRWGRIRDLPHHRSFELAGKTAGIVGLGDIGLAAAERFKALGCRVIASRRSAIERRRNEGPVDELVPASDLPYLLQSSDIVALTLALTAETRHLMNAETLRLMKQSAFLINISRGAVIDEPALIEALRDGVIAGAALDVFEREPLPPDSPLWEMENVVITPHTSAASEHFQRRQIDLFKENLRRYTAGEALLNVVDADRGY